MRTTTGTTRSTSRSTTRTTLHAAAIGAIAVGVSAGGAAYAGSGEAAQRAGGWHGDPPDRVKLHLKTSTPALESCFPNAKAKVRVTLTTEEKGKDTFKIHAVGLKPRTPYTVFLLEQAGAPFGAAEYIGDFDTNRWGEATNKYKLIVEEAFAFNNTTQERTDLNSVGVWFADPADDDGCLGDNSPVTGFDGDAEAGVQMLNSGTKVLP